MNPDIVSPFCGPGRFHVPEIDPARTPGRGRVVLRRVGTATTHSLRDGMVTGVCHLLGYRGAVPPYLTLLGYAVYLELLGMEGV